MISGIQPGLTTFGSNSSNTMIATLPPPRGRLSHAVAAAGTAIPSNRSVSGSDVSITDRASS